MAVDGEQQENRVSVRLLARLDTQLSERATEFWDVWKDEYLKNLSQALGDSSKFQISQGSVVLIDGEGPRLDWPLGVVETVHPSRDGLTRTVSLRTAKGQIVRPIQRICQLEVNDSTPEPSSSPATPIVYPLPSSQSVTDTIPPVPTNNAHMGNNDNQVSKDNPTRSRSGRTIKKNQNPDFIYDSD